jgi:hypothetical protein
MKLLTRILNWLAPKPRVFGVNAHMRSILKHK